MGENIVTAYSEDLTRCDITIRGGLTIESSGDFRTSLIEAMERSNHVYLNAEYLAEIDITGLQTLCSCCKTASVMKKTFAFEGRLPACIPELSVSAGLNFSSPCIHKDNKSCIWFGGQ